MTAGVPARSTPRPLEAGQLIPKLEWKTAQGGRLGTRAPGWCVLVVYRGKHCGMCKRYLIELNGLQPAFEQAGVAVAAVSADAKPRAAGWLRELALRFPLGYGLTESQMKALGLYVSPADEDVDHPFAEPAVFTLRERGLIHFACVGNAPYGRPSLHDVLEGTKKAIEEELDPHGTRWPVRGARVRRGTARG